MKSQKNIQSIESAKKTRKLVSEFHQTLTKHAPKKTYLGKILNLQSENQKLVSGLSSKNYKACCKILLNHEQQDHLFKPDT